MRRTEEDLVAGDPASRMALHELVRGRILVVRDTGMGVTYELVHLALSEDRAMPHRRRDEHGEGGIVSSQRRTAAPKWQ